MLDHLIHHPIGLFHLITALLALVFGTWIILTRKGTLRHKWLGRGYFWAMLLLNASALMIYELKGTFGVFHWLALLSLLTLVAGYIPVLLRRPGWARQHAYWPVHTSACWPQPLRKPHHAYQAGHSVLPSSSAPC